MPTAYCHHGTSCLVNNRDLFSRREGCCHKIRWSVKQWLSHSCPNLLIISISGFGPVRQSQSVEGLRHESRAIWRVGRLTGLRERGLMARLYKLGRSLFVSSGSACNPNSSCLLVDHLFLNPKLADATCGKRRRARLTGACGLNGAQLRARRGQVRVEVSASCLAPGWRCSNSREHLPADDLLGFGFHC
jgi:hypothetical protein